MAISVIIKNRNRFMHILHNLKPKPEKNITKNHKNVNVIGSNLALTQFVDWSILEPSFFQKLLQGFIAEKKLSHDGIQIFC